MDISEIIDPLNKAQRQAVCSEAQNTLVLAGAGSGKTRVLVHRIAWLVQVENVSPYSIMAVTFTNKAAGEMRFRIENLLKTPIRNMWVGTFHGLAHRLLRAHWMDAKLVENFQIIDSDDQLRLIKRIMKEMGIDEKKHPARETQWFINECKDNGLRAEQLNPREFHNREYMLDVYFQYEELCQRTGLVDFAELLLRAHELWLHQPHLLKHYQQRFSHILVDEFQDTNTIQYAWLKVLSGNNLPTTSIHTFVVGDDDQSIYGWRGAKIEHIREFTHDFKAGGTDTVRLEQNYRSTGNILEAANAVIANNSERLGKELWTDDSDGELLQIYKAFNETDEAAYVAGQIDKWIEKGGKRSDVAILYRSNAQSQPHEYELVKRGVPYRVYGGLRFYDRAEIKDALAYMRLLANRQDDAALERIINTPTRGIGQRTLDIIRQTAKEKQQNLWQTAIQLIADKGLSARAATSVQKFIDLIDELQINETESMSLAEQVTHVVEVSLLKEFHGKENSERAQAKVENLDELVNAAKRFDDEGDPLLEAVKEGLLTGNERQDNHPSQPDPMAEFLAHAALEAGEGQAEEWEDCIQLMSLHSAKGLEFELVFLCGLDQGLFPHKNALQDYVGGRLEEERRLCYVGITRARQQLHLSHAESRTIYGRSELSYPSQFLSEIPASLVTQVRATQNSNISSTYSSSKLSTRNHSDDDSAVYIGQRVNHKKFGEGIVIDIEGSGARARVQVNFDHNGTRWLMLNIANLL
ncbi:MAG: DNA helicase II [gamma proteobacterium symbiont of Bathyaustriella thionipta]|nr:DNA helicase II [gamma proteobacterium symbiont of Bathyaustriella thionipta]MCU7949467.1 DNA helicase II [gamma proteobacterium symbiont of Bathyaustriella thionipta]MCU7953114.1 DNA helicase II [gamma proteobacterium symbiont of Bathyaustriella thionipta]MCU7956054.1 DNA helicase II [gamma proteobacterium symbiont of Bathyaustriella thionipta]MCU7966968.1 DNA helicase II [gamma proteobacterium symbiont of Bathyaustriella thionipta]